MKKYFLTGLITLLPLTVTIAVVHWLLRLLTQPFAGIASYLFHPFTERYEFLIPLMSQLLILSALILFTFALGTVARLFFFSALLGLGDKILNKIPFLNKIYKIAKEILHTLVESDKKSFQRVVMTPFPRSNCYILGLVAKDAPAAFQKGAGEKMISIFVPSSPSPTNGFLIMRPESQLISLEMSSEEAIKYIVSCGAIRPANTRESS